MTVRRGLIVGLGALGFMLAAFSVAWACTMQAAVYGVSEAQPAPGETITVRGLEYRGNTAVEIRWATQDGPVLATAVTGYESYNARETPDTALNFGVHRGTFSVEVTVPADATPGEHLIWAIDPEPGALGGVGAYQVVIPGAPEPNAAVSEPELWEESAPAPVEGEPAPAPSQPATGEAPVTEIPAAAPAVAAPAPAAPAAVGTEAPAPVAPAPVAPATTPEPATSEPEPASAGTAPVSEPEPTFAPATAADWRHTHGALLHTEPVTEPAAVDSHTALLHATATPEGSGTAAGELVPQAAETPDAAAGLGAGFALLAVGLVVLFGGAAVAAVVRRREDVPVDGR